MTNESAAYRPATTHTVTLPATVDLTGFDSGADELPDLPERIKPVQIYVEHDGGILKTEFTVAGRRFRAFEQNQGGYAAETVIWDCDRNREGGPEFDSLDDEENEALNEWFIEVHGRIDALVYGIAIATTSHLHDQLIAIATDRPQPAQPETGASEVRKSPEQIAQDVMDEVFDPDGTGINDVTEATDEQVYRAMIAAVQTDRAQRIGGLEYGNLDQLLSAWGNYDGDISGFYDAWIDHINNGVELPEWAEGDNS